MDSFIYALVMVPSLRELLPKSHIAATQANVGFYGGILFALFLIGWGFAFLWGPLADKFGRVRTLMLTILWYSLFTFLGALATGVWQLAAYRLLAGIGIGGEWAMGGTFVAEEWPEERRKMGAGMMHTGYYVGVFLAGHRQLRHRRSLRMACDVCAGRAARAVYRLHPLRRHRATTLGGQK